MVKKKVAQEGVVQVVTAEKIVIINQEIAVMKMEIKIKIMEETTKQVLKLKKG